MRASEGGWTFIELYTCPELYLDDDAPRLAASLSRKGTPVYTCSQDAFRKMSYRDTPDGMLALSPLVGSTLDQLELPEQPLLLITENLEKPGNLGTLLRTAEAAGADAVVVCGHKTDLNNPNVIRASVGTLFFMPVAEASTGETVQWLERKGIRSVAALPAADRDYLDTDLKSGVAIVVGAEDEGLSQEWIAHADIQVSIPMHGRNDSLNVSSAAAVLLYEAARQRR
jgi:TrmH family RNA methyltransferase